MVASFFITSDNGVIVHDVFTKNPLLENLIGLHVPYLYFTKKLEEDITPERLTAAESSLNRYVVGRRLREFVGIEGTVEETTKQAMLNFSYHLATHNMDEAFKAIKLIKR